MRRLHVALAVGNFEASVEEYTNRLGADPVCIVSGVYALWRTPEVNLSISHKPGHAGSLRHLGFEDPEAAATTVDHDCNGIMWERFTAQQQREEIFGFWPDARYHR